MNKPKIEIDLQCGVCMALVHQSDPPQKFCPCCGAGYERWCFQCNKRVEMFFEEWWPTDDEGHRTYWPAKHCPTCNTGLEVETKDQSKNDSHYNH